MSSYPNNPAIGFLSSSLSRERASPGPDIEAEVLHLFDLMQIRLLRYSLSFGIPLQDGEDVVQEAFLALFRHLQLDRSRANLQGWLFQVTHNLALKCRLKNSHSTQLPANTADRCDPDPNPEAQMLAGEKYSRLQCALDALSNVDQSCLRLRAEGLRYREISKILGISLGSVSASLARSLARLERADRR